MRPRAVLAPRAGSARLAATRRRGHRPDRRPYAVCPRGYPEWRVTPSPSTTTREQEDSSRTGREGRERDLRGSEKRTLALRRSREE